MLRSHHPALQKAFECRSCTQPSQFREYLPACTLARHLPLLALLHDGLERDNVSGALYMCTCLRTAFIRYNAQLSNIRDPEAGQTTLQERRDCPDQTLKPAVNRSAQLRIIRNILAHHLALNLLLQLPLALQLPLTLLLQPRSNHFDVLPQLLPLRLDLLMEVLGLRA